jgi:hypothetical protein
MQTRILLRCIRCMVHESEFVACERLIVMSTTSYSRYCLRPPKYSWIMFGMLCIRILTMSMQWDASQDSCSLHSSHASRVWVCRMVHKHLVSWRDYELLKRVSFPVQLLTDHARYAPSFQLSHGLRSANASMRYFFSTSHCQWDAGKNSSSRHSSSYSSWAPYLSEKSATRSPKMFESGAFESASFSNSPHKMLDNSLWLTVYS